MAILTKQEIMQALGHLGKLAQEQGHSIELLLMGGAAMVLMYNARPSTRDVDVLILSPSKVEPYLVPGAELKAQYAFLDLWETTYGTD